MSNIEKDLTFSFHNMQIPMQNLAQPNGITGRIEEESKSRCPVICSNRFSARLELEQTSKLFTLSISIFHATKFQIQPKKKFNSFGRFENPSGENESKSYCQLRASQYNNNDRVNLSPGLKCSRGAETFYKIMECLNEFWWNNCKLFQLDPYCPTETVLLGK